MDENVKLALLYDIYGGILTDKQRDIFELSHNEDLSLGEIAENLGISRQGVRDALIHAAAALTQAEEQLHVLADRDRRLSLIGEAQKIASRSIDNASRARLNDILTRLTQLG